MLRHRNWFSHGTYEAIETRKVVRDISNVDIVWS
jgi:hypothetical protein